MLPWRLKPTAGSGQGWAVRQPWPERRVPAAPTASAAGRNEYGATPMAEEGLQLKRYGELAELVLARPERQNAINRAMWQALRPAIAPRWTATRRCASWWCAARGHVFRRSGHRRVRAGVRRSAHGARLQRNGATSDRPPRAAGQANHRRYQRQLRRRWLRARGGMRPALRGGRRALGDHAGAARPRLQPGRRPAADGLVGPHGRRICSTRRAWWARKRPGRWGWSTGSCRRPSWWPSRWNTPVRWWHCRATRRRSIERMARLIARRCHGGDAGKPRVREPRWSTRIYRGPRGVPP